MSPSISAPDRLRVVDVCGEHLYWVDELGAQDLLKRGLVRLIRRRGRMRMLQAREDAGPPPQLQLAGRGSGLDHMRYSHRRETVDNPPRVWTLLHSTQILGWA